MYASHRNYPRPRSAESSNQAGSGRTILLIIIMLFVCFGIFHSVKGHALASAAAIKSGISDTCLNLQNDTAGAVVNGKHCNGSDDQVWNAGIGIIEHDGSLCLSVANNQTANGSPIVVNKCDDDPGQVWLRDKNGYQNPNSGLCLAVPDGQAGRQLALSSCTQLNQPDETWTPGSDAIDQAAAACKGAQGQKIACLAERDWTQWQVGTPTHEALLTTYTDGAPYEEWCADFVSYVYKQAGAPFTQGNTDGWDENIAGNIQNMGFTRHSATSYTPHPGDVAYFDYSGGHVEIVVAGGSKPTFIYGNSGTIDPTTGNGEMQANTITQEPGVGQVQYYLSPN